MSLKYRDANGVEQGIAGTPYDTLKELGDRLDALQTYSTEEINTGKTWTDGRPIYRKVCYSTAAATIAGSGAAYTTIPGWYFSDIRTIVNWHCSIDLVQYHGDSNLSKWATLYTSTVNVPAGSFLMVEYTKTTD